MTLLNYESNVMLLLAVVIGFVSAVCGSDEGSVFVRAVGCTSEDLISGLLCGKPGN